jgi:hypothetical protein
MEHTLITLAEFHYWSGLIGVDEFLERVDIAHWLAELNEVSLEDDPRRGADDEYLPNEQVNTEERVRPDAEKRTSTSGSPEEHHEPSIEFLFLDIWVFTKADPDSYPSVPHGHFQIRNRRWPKLNPYTGRVFSSKYQEDRSKRLTKREMQQLWSDDKFKSFCREMVVWYHERFPYFNFPVRHPLRMPRW